MSLNVSGSLGGAGVGAAAALGGVAAAVGGTAVAMGEAALGKLEGLGAQLLKAKMFNPMMPVDFVLFDFNPKSIKTSGTQFTAAQPTGSQNTGGRTGTRGARWQGRAPVKLEFQMTFDDGDPELGDMLLDVATGSTCKQKVDLMFNWMGPGPSSLLGAAISMIAGATFTLEPPTIVFQWGPPKAGFLFPGKIKSCSAAYTRFHFSGVPTRAEVQVTMEEVVSGVTAFLTNPTSGGRPGRQSHMITDGENLQSLAVAKYGRPGMWRQIAAANNIDNPMAVRPGQVVYLPGREEIGDL